MKKAFILFFLLVIPMSVLMMLPANAENLETITDRIVPIAIQYDGSKSDFKYFGSSGTLGYAKFVTNELYGVPFSKEIPNRDYTKLYTINSFSELQNKSDVGDILCFGDSNIAIVVSKKSDAIKITQSCDWDKNNGHTETTLVTSTNYSNIISSCEIWRKNNTDMLYGDSETPALGIPYTTVVGNDCAYIKCTIFRNDCLWNFAGAYWGTDPDNMSLAGSDKLKLTGNTWSGFTLRNLQPDTTYYFKFFISTSNKNYWSDVVSFKTTNNLSEPTFGAPYTTKIEKDNAYIKCSLFKNNFSANKVGAYIGTAPDDLKEWGYDKVGNVITWGGYTLKGLEPDTTYYYRFYLKNDDNIYWSDIASFKTSHDHDYTAVTIKKPTCTEEGIEELTCRICGIEQKSAIPMIPHNYIDTLVAPTYLEQGCTIHTCTECGDEYKDTFTDKLMLDTVNDLKATGLYNDHVDMTWTKVNDAQGYIIFKYDFSDETWSEISRTISNVSSYSIPNLPVGTVHRFAIKAYKIVEGKEVSSPELSIVTTATRPDPVTSFSVKSYTDNSITLTWYKCENADGYLIYYYDKSQDIWAKRIIIKDSDADTYTDENLQSGIKYEYIIYTLTQIDDSQFASSEVCLKTSAYTKPATVTGFKTLSSTTDLIKLTWNKVNEANGYIIYKYDTAKKIWSRIAKTDSNINTYTATNLSPGTTYKFAVKVYMTVDEQEYASVKYPTLITATNPAAVTGLKSVASSASAVKLSWSKVSDANGYIIYRYDAANRKWVRIAKTKTTANTYLATGLKSGTTYKFAVKAYKTVNGKEISSVSFPQVNTTTTPAAVKYTITAGNKKALLKWGKVTGATGYDVYYKTSANASWQKLTSTKALNFVKTGLATRKTYYFAVRAYRAFGGKNYYGPFTNKSIKIK